MSCELGWWHLIMSHHPVKFNGHRPHRSRNITFFLSHETSHDHVIERTFNFVVLAPYPKLPSCQVWWPQVSWKWRYNVYLPCNLMYPHDQQAMSFYGEHLFIPSYLPVKFGSRRSPGSENITFFIYHVTTWASDWRVMWICWGWSFTLTHQLVKYNGHKVLWK